MQSCENTLVMTDSTFLVQNDIDSAHILDTICLLARRFAMVSSDGSGNFCTIMTGKKQLLTAQKVGQQKRKRHSVREECFQLELSAHRRLKNSPISLQ